MQLVSFAHSQPPTDLTLGFFDQAPFLFSSSTDHIPVTRNVTLAQHQSCLYLAAISLGRGLLFLAKTNQLELILLHRER